MTLLCGECENVIEIDSPLADQQHISCPHCGITTIYSKPTRIEIPEEYRKRQVVDSSNASPSAKSKLRVIRSNSSLSHDSAMAANYEMRGVNQHLDQLKEYKEKEDALMRRMQKRNLISNLITIGLGLAFVGGIWFGYQKWTDSKRRKAEEYNRILEARNRERERHEAEQQAQLAERRKKEEQERLARIEKQRLEEESRRAEVEARRAKEREEREREESARASIVESYKMYIEGLRSNEFDLYTQNFEASLIKKGATVCYCLPAEDSFYMPLYQVAYETNGQMNVSRIFKGGKKEKLDTDIFKQRISATDCMVVYNKKVYFRSSRKNPGMGILPKDMGCDPSKIFFGDIANTLNQLNLIYDELSYDIVFIPEKSKKQLLVENLSFGCRYSIQNVYEAIEKAFPANSTGKVNVGRVKKFKRTVLFWNGSHIKTSIDGITYVPRTYIRNSPRVRYNSISTRYTRNSSKDDDGYSRWESLYEQAKREEEAEANYYEQVQLRRQNNQERANDEWRNKIEEIFKNGQLLYKIRKVQNTLPTS